MADAKQNMISELVGMDDAALTDKLGFADQVSAFKANMVRADKLTGPARKKVLNHLANTFAPSSYAVSDIGYTIDRAEAKATGKTTPASIVADACCCGDD